MEVMVAVSIFAIVVTVGIGALLTINNNYRKAQTSRQAIDSLTYILETMSRSLRTAQVWNTGNSSYYFAFKDQDGVDVAYNFIPTEGIFMITNGIPYKLNPSNVIIENVLFTQLGDSGQTPYLQINIAGTVSFGKNSSEFAFQTGVSKRTSDQ